MRDLRLAIRTLRSTPAVSTVVILSLGLGIGVNSAIFSVADSLLLRPLPAERADRLALLAPTSSPGRFWDGRLDTRTPAWTYPLWDQIRERSRDLFESVFAFAPARFNLARGGRTDFIDGLWASGDYFDALGVSPVLGRTFAREDDRRGGGPDGPVAVISYPFWQRRFGGAADVIGRTVAIERVSVTVVGVMPPRFFGAQVGRSFDVAVPFGVEPLIYGSESALDRHSSWWVRVMVRLKDGQTLPAAEQAVRALQPQIREATVALGARPTERYLTEPFALAPAAAGVSPMRAAYGQPLLTLMALVAFVLLIACANVANLLLAPTTARRHEASVRLALGAPRRRLARQLLVESLLLAGAGALAGLAVAHWGSRLLVQQLSTEQNAIFLDVGIGGRVLLFNALVAAAAALLFGLAPALLASRARPIEAIREHGRGGAAERRFGLGSLLVAGQVAFSLVLVVAAGLFLRTLASLSMQDLGFEREPVLLAQLDLQESDPARRRALYERVEQASAATPGVARSALSSVTPVSGVALDIGLEVENERLGTVPRRVSYINTVTPGWFATYGTGLVAGRDFGVGDRATTAPVAIVNKAFVDAFLPGVDPIGQRLRNARPTAREQGGWMEIVGVVEDAAYISLREPPPPTLYMPAAQQPELEPAMTLSVRAAGGEPARLARGVLASIASVNPDIAVTFTPLERQVDAALLRERIVATLAGCFGALALLLAALGLYGVTAYNVNRRRAEIGIRIALGSTRGGVVRLVLSRVGIIVCIGVLIGMGVSLWMSKLVAPLLYGLEPGDPVTFALSAAVLATVGLFAGWLPAQRACRIAPADVLRDE